MTNKDKYLKDNVSVEELAKTMIEDNIFDFTEEDIIAFFNKNITPTLTEDERVILRNIDNYRYEKIKRVKGILVLFNVFTRENEETPFADNLFQFIKERRRIFYK